MMVSGVRSYYEAHKLLELLKLDTCSCDLKGKPILLLRRMVLAVEEIHAALQHRYTRHELVGNV